MVLRGLLLLTLVAMLAFSVLAVMQGAGVIDLFGTSQRPDAAGKYRADWVSDVAEAFERGSPASPPLAGTWRLTETPTSSPGWEIRYNATLAQARRGSPQVSLVVLREILDVDQQVRNFRVPRADGTATADEEAAYRTVLNGLMALNEWQKHKGIVDAVGRDNPQLEEIRQAVVKLTAHPNLPLSTEAKKVRLALEG